MPKYRKETEEAKAKSLIKPYIKCGLNQSKLARQEGVTQSAINQRINRKPVQDCLQQYLNSDKLKKELQKVASEGLKASRVIPAADSESMDSNVPDHGARYKFWHDLMIVGGHLKPSENKITAAVFVGDDFGGWLKEIKDNQVRSDARLD